MDSILQENNARMYPNQPLIGVGIMVFMDDNILLVRRGQEPNKGKWSVPGGLVKLGERLEAAAHRELFEECGIKVRLQDRLNVFEYIQRDKHQKVKYHYIIVDYLAEYLEGKLLARSDIDRASWVHTDEIQSLDVTDGLQPAIATAVRMRKKLRDD